MIMPFTDSTTQSSPDDVASCAGLPRFRLPPVTLTDITEVNHTPWKLAFLSRARRNTDIA